MSYLKGTSDLGKRLGGGPNGETTLQSFSDASFAVHPDMKSHNGQFITLGLGGTNPILRATNPILRATNPILRATFLALRSTYLALSATYLVLSRSLAGLYYYLSRFETPKKWDGGSRYLTAIQKSVALSRNR